MSDDCAACRARKRRRETRAVETPEYAKAAARMIRALGKRAAEDVDAIPDLLDLTRILDDVLGEAVRAAVRPVEAGGMGWSYGDVARRLGVTRQAVHKRFGGTAAGPTTEGTPAPA